MYSKKIKNKVLQKVYSEPFNRGEVCKPSKASAAIMLERMSKGKEIDFPFSQ